MNEPERKCARCDGCGKIADTPAGEPWTQWEDLPPALRGLVTIGMVRAIDCPDCVASRAFLAGEVPRPKPSLEECAREVDAIFGKVTP